MVVAYQRGSTEMRRRIDGGWIDEQLGPGDVSLLTRAAGSHWIWPNDIEVVHVYLGQQELARTCREMYEREVADVELCDEVRADDPAIHRTAMLIAHEAAQGGAGSRLLVDALSCQLSVHILRRHAHVLFREHTSPHEFVLRQRVARARTMLTRTDAPLSDVAMACGFADQSHLNRVFKSRVGTTPGRFRERR